MVWFSGNAGRVWFLNHSGTLKKKHTEISVKIKYKPWNLVLNFPSSHILNSRTYFYLNPPPHHPSPNTVPWVFTVHWTSRGCQSLCSGGCLADEFGCPNGRSSPQGCWVPLPGASRLPLAQSWSKRPSQSRGAELHVRDPLRTSVGCKGKTVQREPRGPARRSGQRWRAAGRRIPPGTRTRTNRPAAPQQPGGEREPESWIKMWGWSNGWG